MTSDPIRVRAMVHAIDLKTAAIMRRIERKRRRVQELEEANRTFWKRVMRAWKPTHKEIAAARGPVPAGTVSVAELAQALGVSARTVADWAKSGHLPAVKHGVHWRFALETAMGAVQVVRLPNGKAYNAKGSDRTQMLLTRAEERASDSDDRTCGCCRQPYPMSTYPPSQRKSGRFTCGDCMSPYRRASDARRRSSIELTQVEHVSTLAVAKRDGWRCAICTKQVTRETWSLDHMVPLSKGGAHTYDNVALAHRDCNTARGVGGGGRPFVQAALFPRMGVVKRR